MVPLESFKWWCLWKCLISRISDTILNFGGNQKWHLSGKLPAIEWVWANCGPLNFDGNGKCCLSRKPWDLEQLQAKCNASGMNGLSYGASENAIVPKFWPPSWILRKSKMVFILKTVRDWAISSKIWIQWWQGIHGVDVTHDNVFLLCYPVSFHVLQLLLTGHPISS